MSAGARQKFDTSCLARPYHSAGTQRVFHDALGAEWARAKQKAIQFGPTNKRLPISVGAFFAPPGKWAPRMGPG